MADPSSLSITAQGSSSSGSSSRNMYGYEDAAPTTSASASGRNGGGNHRWSKDVGNPSAASTATTSGDGTDAYGESGKYHRHSRRFRRSSLVGNSNWEASRERRRATIQHLGSQSSTSSSSSAAAAEPEIIEVLLPGMAVPVRRRRSVGFDDGASTVIPGATTPAGGDDHDDEARWLQQSDYDDISRANEKIVRYVRRNSNGNNGGRDGTAEGSWDGDGSSISRAGVDLQSANTGPDGTNRLRTQLRLCTRGLEGMISEASTASSQDRDHAREAVLEEQRAQREAGRWGTYDEGRIAQRYHFASIQPTLLAADRAATDEAEVQTYLKDTRRMMRRMSV